MDAGRVIAQGTPDHLKRQVGTDRLELVLTDSADLDAATAALASVVRQAPTVDPARRALSVAVTGGFATLAAITAEVYQASIRVEDVTLRRSTLDDVFLRLTGHHTTSAPAPVEVPA